VKGDDAALVFWKRFHRRPQALGFVGSNDDIGGIRMAAFGGTE